MDVNVVVIGAGPAGLAAAACLAREGVAHEVLERESETGALWQRHYDRLHLHTTSRFSALPMTPWPAGSALYPSRDDFVRYLRDYARAHAVSPRFGVDVHAVRREAGAWAVQAHGRSTRARHVVVATGRNRLPRRPELGGIEGFPGPVVHASDYRNPRPFIGRRVLVVGCGNSGAEIALDLAEHDVPVALAVRGPVQFVPRDLFGRPAQHVNIALRHLPARWRDAIAVPAVRLATGDLSRWGLTRPGFGPNRMIEQFGRVPLLDIGTLATIRRGRIAVRPGVLKVTGPNVHFADGAVRPFDALLLATGYDTGLDRLFEGCALPFDATGCPVATGPAFEGLHFVGFRVAANGALREISLEAQRVASAIRRSLSARSA